MAKTIYVAGPLFSQAERDFLVKMTDELSRTAGLDPIADFFLPHRDAGDVGVAGTRTDIFSEDLRRLDEASIIIALLDGADVDSGTAVEIGYAYSGGRKIFGLLTDFRMYSEEKKVPSKINNMIWGACEEGRTIYNNLDELGKALKQHLSGTKERQ